MLQVKGGVLIDAMSLRKARLGEKEHFRLLGLLDPETKKIFQGRLISTEWYPLDAWVDFIEVDVRELWKGNPKGLIEASEKVIEKQLRGIYRFLIKLGSPESIIKRLTVINSTYLKGIEVQPTIVAPGKAVIRYRGLEKRHKVIEYTFIGFYRKALEISGAKNFEASITTSIADGKGYFELTVTWDPK
jgi:hypothetical protein